MVEQESLDYLFISQSLEALSERVVQKLRRSEKQLEHISRFTPTAPPSQVTDVSKLTEVLTKLFKPFTTSLMWLQTLISKDMITTMTQ